MLEAGKSVPDEGKDDGELGEGNEAGDGETLVQLEKASKVARVPHDASRKNGQQASLKKTQRNM